MSSIYDFEAQSIDGKPVPLRQFEGKPLLIVNTASACGFTPQFGGLEKLHQTYGSRGLVVLGFPCNQFGAQDSGTNGEIAEFCQLNYGVSFPMMAKVDVNGPQTIKPARVDELPGCIHKRKEGHGPTVPGVFRQDVGQGRDVRSDHHSKVPVRIVTLGGPHIFQPDP